MALLFCDSFDHYQTSDILKKWTGFLGGGGTSQFAISNRGDGVIPPGGGQMLSLPAPSSGIMGGYKQYANSATVVHGGWIYFITGSSPSYVRFFQMMDGVTTQLDLRGDSAGHISLTRNGTGLATSTNTLTANTWYHIEFKATIDPSVGAYEVRVDGVAWIGPTTGANTRATANSYSNGIGFLTDTSPHRFYVKSAYVLDTTGSVANNFLGQVRVACLRPTEAGNYSQWTPNAGVNFSGVDEVLLDSDTTFNMSATANQIDTFRMTDCPIPSGSVYGVQHVLGAKQDGGAARRVSSVQRSASVDYVGTSQALSGSYSFLLDPKTVNPATSAAYTVSEVNALEAGYKLVT